MSNKKIQLLTILPLLFGLTALLHPVEVKKKDIRHFKDFQQGEFRGTSLDNRGWLFLGPRLKALTGPGREYFLSLDTTPNGDIYIGTGHKASVFRIKAKPSPAAANTPPANAVEEIFSSDQLDVYALLARSNGDVFAATSPDGKIYKVSRNSKDKTGSEFFNPGEKFIWDLKEDRSGNLVCAVGNAGGVYRIDKSGSGSKIFTPEDTHIMSLYITRGDSILAGSGDRGILYRIDNRKAKVLFDSPYEEIRGICEDKDGNIYFAATRGTFNRIQPKPSTPNPLLKQKEKEKVINTPNQSVLYRLNTNGTVEEIWESRTEYIYSVFYDSGSGGVIIGTGDSGRVYRIDKDGGFSIIYESDSAQVFKIAGNGGGFALVANNTASVVSIEDTLNSSGTYFSDVYDLEIQSKLGRLYWDAGTTPQTSVQLFVRTGNSNVPDKTWSQWSAPFTDSDNSTLGVSNCRYFQLKVALNSKSSAQSPHLKSLTVYYIQSNLSPRIKKIVIGKPDRRLVKSPEGYTKVGTPNRLNARWDARDLNKDKLKYNVSIKKENDAHWISIKEDTTRNALELNTRLYEDGKYLMRVAADDALANSPDTSKSHAMVSSPFLIDSTAPMVSDFSAVGKRIKFTVTDSTSIVSTVLYSLDGNLWFPVFPTDTINDSKSETFDFNLNDTKSKKIIFLKVMDEFTNSKVFQKEL
ncbi:MAG: hypothetical protein GY940_16515 [bacterium]|nr:hypothetical protein [bacterium]